MTRFPLASVRAAILCSCVIAALVLFPRVTIAQVDDVRPPENAEANDEPEGFLPEPRLISKAITFADRKAGNGGEPKDGFYPELENMITGAGWISAGPGYRTHLFNRQLLVDGSAAVSWRSYLMGQVRVEAPRLARERLTIGSQFRWQDLTQVNYFGPGAGSLEENRSEYRLKSTNLVGYAVVTPLRALAVTGRVGWLGRPTIHAPSGSFDRGFPDTRELFPTDPVYTRAEQPRFLHGTVSAVVDTRDHRSHPTSGGVYRAAWSTYSDRDGGDFGFQRYEGEGLAFVPIVGRRIVLAMHGWVVGTDTREGAEPPFYLMPTLGGSNTLRSFNAYRFHDRNLALVNAEARIALFTHVDAAGFVDAGNVAARFGDLDLSRRSYGVGLRLHTHKATFARLDMAHGSEGWRFMFNLSDPLHLSRLSRRTAAIPFVP